MLLRQLFEAETKHVTFCFGRMNPPTIGHKQVLDTMKSQGGEMKIFLSQSQDKKKNPLDYGTKIKFIKEMFPQYAKDVVENAALNTIGKVASYLHEQGYTAVTFVAGSDRLEDMKNLLTQYNGVEGKAHGFYKFDVIDFASSGDREDGAEGVAGVSASGARSAAANNDFEGFQEATGAGELAKPLFAAVRKGMGIKDEIEEGWKEKLAGAALAGSMALGMGGNAQAHNLDNFSTTYLQKVAAGEGGRAMVSIDDAKAELQNRAKQQTSQQSADTKLAPTKTGFSKTYLQSVVDGSHPRPLISKEKAQELLNQLNKGVEEGFMSFLKSEPPPKKKWDPAKDSRVVSNKKDDDAWIRLLLDKHRRGISLTDREWNSIQQWKLKKSMSTEDWFGGYKSTGKWFLKKDGDVIRTVNGEPFTFKNKEDALKWAMKNYKVSYEKQRIIPTTNPDKNLITTEAPIEMDPADPMDPMIHSHDKANPAKLKYRMLRAAGQLKDLAARAENASPGEWQIMARQFEELKMNMEQIRHALEELGKIKSKGGIRSRGITV